MKVSIIIRAFNEEKYFERLLQGIDAQEYDSGVEVILVDSGSTDNTVSIAEKYNAKIVSIKPEEFTFGYALNVGCRSASGDVFLFASAHVYPLYNNWIEQMIYPFKKDEEVVCVYGKQVGDERSKFSEKELFKSWFPDNSDFNQSHPFSNNANCAILKKAWEKNQYNESLTGLEDLFWAKSMLNKNKKIAYNHLATIVHVHEESYKNILNRYRREAITLKLIYPEMKSSLLKSLQLFWKSIISDLGSAIKEGVYFKCFIEIILFRYCQIYGAHLGFNDVECKVTKELRKKFYYPANYFKTSNNSELKNDELSKQKIVYDREQSD